MSNVTPMKRQAVVDAPVWLSPKQVCARVPGITVEKLTDLRKRGAGPKYYKPTLRTVIYAQSDIDAWVARSAVSTREQS